MIQLTLGLGWIINWEKSSTTPTQSPIYLGAEILLDQGLVRPTGPRCQTLEEEVSLLLAAQAAQAATWLRVLGLMASMVDLVPWCRLRMRPIQIHLLAFFRPSLRDLTVQVPVTPHIRPHLRWWLEGDCLTKGQVFPTPSPEVLLVTDASLEGWGASPRERRWLLAGGRVQKRPGT